MKKLLSACVLSVALAANSQGNVECLADYSSPSSGGNDGNIGFVFKAGGDLTVIQLGVFSYILDQVGPITLGLWDSGGALVASTVVSNTSPLINLTRYETMPQPLSLTAQQVYTIGAFIPSLVGVNLVGGQFGGSCTISPAVQYLGYASAQGSGLARPLPLAGGESLIPGVANFRHLGIPVPEPSCCGLLMLGLALIAGVRKFGL